MNSDLMDFLAWLQQKSESGEIFMTEKTVRIVASYAADYCDEKERNSLSQTNIEEKEQ